jgi:hypothetical protein
MFLGWTEVVWACKGVSVLRGRGWWPKLKAQMAADETWSPFDVEGQSRCRIRCLAKTVGVRHPCSKWPTQDEAETDLRSFRTASAPQSLAVHTDREFTSTARCLPALGTPLWIGPDRRDTAQPRGLREYHIFS